jgi:glycosyltransferase involved in cell wall biosynthesis
VARWIDRASRGRLRESSEWIDFSARAWRRIARTHRRSRFDVLQFPNYSGSGLFSTLFLPVPSAVRLSTSGPEWNELAGIPRDADRRVGEWIEALQLRLARDVYAPSRKVRDMALSKAGVAKIDLLPTPFFLETGTTDPSLYRERFEGKQYLLFFGRYQLHKGFHILAQALDEVLERNPNAHAAFVGMDLPSVLGASMREYAERLCPRHRSRLIFIGQTPHSRLYPVITGARLVVLPSLVDNLPNACLEAMALEKPVVGTLDTSMDELLTEGVTGFLVPPGDSRALAEKLNAVWNSPDLERIGREAAKRAKEFEPAITIPLLEEYFRSIIEAS